MIHTIRLDHILRESVKTPYRDLVTRATGAAVRTSIEHAIAQANCSTALLDFSDVGLVDFSCADEVVAKLLLGTERDSGRYVVLQGLREEHTETIEHVLSHHRIAVVVIDEPGDAPRVLGRITPDLEAVFFRLHDQGPTTASTAAEALDWPLERATDALETMARLRLAQVEGDTYRPLPTI